MFHQLVTIRKPSLILEIGIDRAVTTAHLCDAALPYGGVVVGIDIAKKDGVDRVRSEYPNFLFYNMDATKESTAKIVRNLTTSFGRIGFVYQDSSHHYLASIKEWVNYSPLLDHDFMWICDDITPAFHDPKVDPPGKGMVQYWEETGQNYHKELFQDLHIGSVQGVIASEY